MGSPVIATRPTMTMMMEMTIATIGLLIKNFDMVTYLFSDGVGEGFASVLPESPEAAAGF